MSLNKGLEDAQQAGIVTTYANGGESKKTLNEAINTQLGRLNEQDEKFTQLEEKKETTPTTDALKQVVHDEKNRLKSQIHSILSEDLRVPTLKVQEQPTGKPLEAPQA